MAGLGVMACSFSAFADSIPRESATLTIDRGGPGQCSAVGLTPAFAAREHREEARKKYAEWQAYVEQKERERAVIETTMRLRQAALSSRPTPSSFDALPVNQAQVTPAELVRASATPTPGVAFVPTVVTNEILATNDAINANPRRYSFYDPEGHLLAETELTTAEQPAIEWSYVWFDSQPLAQINDRTGEISYYFNDHLGTPILQTNMAGTVVWRAEYEPFGDVFAFRVGAERYQPLRFPGQEATESGDLSYNIHRWYRRSMGRYTQPDPIDPRDGLSPYAYALGNPLRFFDPLGLYPTIDCPGCGDTRGTRVRDALDELTRRADSVPWAGLKRCWSRSRDKLTRIKCVTDPSECRTAGERGEAISVRAWYDGGGSVRVCPSAFSTSCGLLNTLAHESLHDCFGLPDFPKPSDTDAVVLGMADKYFPSSPCPSER